MALAIGFNYKDSAWLSNMAASIVVGKVGTATVTLNEINEYLQEEMLRTSHTILKLEELKKIVSLAKSTGKTIVFTNGCFDIIHGGHIEFLQKAKALGDLLVVGLNSDESVRELKGEGRPIKSERERANIISALKYVDYITILPKKSSAKYAPTSSSRVTTTRWMKWLDVKSSKVMAHA
jgi:D-beta-D-heptose 7-phosphate kinase/D-beta-D-heptose 1-phosphate adenosyltransferase